MSVQTKRTAPGIVGKMSDNPCSVGCQTLWTLPPLEVVENCPYPYQIAAAERSSTPKKLQTVLINRYTNNDRDISCSKEHIADGLLPPSYTQEGRTNDTPVSSKFGPLSSVSGIKRPRLEYAGMFTFN